MRILWIILLAAMLALLFGCATDCPVAPVAIQTQEVEVPVTHEVPCKIVAPAKPNRELPAIPSAAPMSIKARAALDDLDRLDIYDGLLEAAIASCQ